MTMTEASVGELVGLDETRANAFSSGLLGALNNGALCLMASIGHRTRLCAGQTGVNPGSASPRGRSA